MVFHIELIRTVPLKEFPSASSIQFYNGNLYLVGDDASFILILDPDYNRMGTIKLFDHSEKRIPKTKKSDLEASVIVNQGKEDFLIAFGSGATEKRMVALSIPLSNQSEYRGHIVYDTGLFLKGLLLLGIAEINIEGAAIVGDALVLANRSNYTHQNNYLIVTGQYFWLAENDPSVRIVEMILPKVKDEIPGISELQYLPSRDLLLFTASAETTPNAYDDGEVTSSYLGWIEDFSKKLSSSMIRVDEWIKLPNVSIDFLKQKIEGLCIESEKGNELIVHLVSDNDNGESTIFKLRMTSSE
jgi:hypothetical protein